ncbi:MAG: ABC transporter permease [Verrucomicrobia bacterium]|nr:ABC transporter permease [Verrucomicrobiota bacterium]
MRDYVLRRLLLLPLTFVGITFVAFCFTRFVPGGPIEQALAERQQADRKRSTAARPSGPASPEELDNLKRRYGFDRSLPEAYAIWLGAVPGPADWITVRLDKDGKAEAEVADDLAPGKSMKLVVTQAGRAFTLATAEGKPRAHWFAVAAPLPDDPEKATRVLVYRRAYAGLFQAELGDSTTSDKPVWDEIKSRLPLSAWFGGWSLLLAYAISIPLGVAKALKRDGWFDRGSSQALFVLYSIPGFILAVAMLQFLCFQLGWFPTKGFDWAHLSWAGRFHHTVVPLACEMIGAFTALTLFTRNGLLDNLAADYVRTAKAKGLSHARIVFVHALRNSLIPLAATFGGNLGFFLTGSFLIEVTFNIPGLGLLGYDSLVHRDFPVFLGLLTLSSLAMLLGNIVSDLCVAAVDPRIRFDKSA